MWGLWKRRPPGSDSLGRELAALAFMTGASNKVSKVVSEKVGRGLKVALPCLIQIVSCLGRVFGGQVTGLRLSGRRQDDALPHVACYSLLVVRTLEARKRYVESKDYFRIRGGGPGQLSVFGSAGLSSGRKARRGAGLFPPGVRRPPGVRNAHARAARTGSRDFCPNQLRLSRKRRRPRNRMTERTLIKLCIGD